MKSSHIPQLPELPEQEAPHFAALDLGSNSFHLITARLVNHDLQAVQKFKQKVGLGAGLKRNGYLSEKAINRGLDALKLCAQRLEGFPSEQVKVVATHTLREALNSELFLARAAEVLPYPIAIISGHEEARLIYHGVAQTTAGTGQRLVVDIGGGSTEIISGHGFETDYLASRSLGCVTYTERFFNTPRVTAKRFKKALIAARRELEPVAQALRKFHHQHFFGTSGTIKALSLWAEKQAGATLGTIPLTELYRLRDRCIELEHVQQFSQLGVDEARIPLLAAGVAILIAIMEEFEISVLTAHDAALREGVLYELADSRLNHRDVRQRTIESLATRYFVDRAQAQRVRDCALDMLAQVRENWEQRGKQPKVFLSWSSLLHEVGLQIN
nr:exopolyphosphatase [Aliidiomarina celeris]